MHSRASFQLARSGRRVFLGGPHTRAIAPCLASPASPEQVAEQSGYCDRPALKIAHGPRHAWHWQVCPDRAGVRCARTAHAAERGDGARHVVVGLGRQVQQLEAVVRPLVVVALAPQLLLGLAWPAPAARARARVSLCGARAASPLVCPIAPAQCPAQAAGAGARGYAVRLRADSAARRIFSPAPPRALACGRSIIGVLAHTLASGHTQLLDCIRHTLAAGGGSPRMEPPD